jgi:hypothetical protein
VIFGACIVLYYTYYIDEVMLHLRYMLSCFLKYLFMAGQPTALHQRDVHPYLTLHYIEVVSAKYRYSQALAACLVTMVRGLMVSVVN